MSERVNDVANEPVTRDERNKRERDVRVAKMTRHARAVLGDDPGDSFDAGVLLEDLLADLGRAKILAMDEDEDVAPLTARSKVAELEKQLGAVAAVVAAMAGYVVLPPPEPRPVPNASTSTWQEVIEDLRKENAIKLRLQGDLSLIDLVTTDMADRERMGMERYQTVLQPHNGRYQLEDAYAEALDLAVYRRNMLREMGAEGDEGRGRIALDLILPTECVPPEDLDRVVASRAYRAALSTVLLTREEIERRAEKARSRV